MARDTWAIHNVSPTEVGRARRACLIRRRIPRVVIEASAVEACPGCVVLSSVVVASVHKQQKDEHERCAEDGDWEISGLCPDGAGPAT